MAHQYDRWYQPFTIRDQNGKMLVPVDAWPEGQVVPDTVRTVHNISILINDTWYSYSEGTVIPVTESDIPTGQVKVYIDGEQTDLERILSFQCSVDFDGVENETLIHSDKVNSRLSPSLDWSDHEQ